VTALSGTYSTALSGTYSTGQGYQRASAGLNGTVIAHTDGVTFTPYSSDTFALVEAKGAEGASVSSYPGVKIDSRGYAVVPYLNPYQMNDISIDPKDTASDVELDNTSQKVAPYSGAVVKVQYSTQRGTPMLVSAARAEGPSVPPNVVTAPDSATIEGTSYETNTDKTDNACAARGLWPVARRPDMGGRHLPTGAWYTTNRYSDAEPRRDFSRR
jgi:outer membrane usher protein FimD/PapC